MISWESHKISYKVQFNSRITQAENILASLTYKTEQIAVLIEYLLIFSALCAKTSKRITENKHEIRQRKFSNIVQVSA